MGQSTRLPRNPPETPGTARRESAQADQHTPVDTDELLELLGDEYTYRVFEAVVEQPRTGRELIDATGVSKATVYRRLDELEEAGLVESTLRVSTDGNHCKEFHAVATSIQVSVGADGLSALVEAESRPGATEGTAAGAQPPADD
jgi:DNA-binding transcriptional ArsR family regulator